MTTSEEYKKDLKIQALLEKVSNIVTNYEDQVANLRVELTVRTEEHKQAVADLQMEIQRLNRAEPAPGGVEEPDVVSGEVVEETDEG